MNLFVVYVGGKTETSLIEVHDIHFALGETITDTYDQIRAQWWGTPKSLHLDAWGILKNVDGYEITLHNTPARQDEHHLFFVNLGGYNLDEFTELHKNIFVVAKNKSEAKLKAKSQVSHWKVPHIDNLLEIDDCVNVTALLNDKKVFIHLHESTAPGQFNFTCKYVPLK